MIDPRQETGFSGQTEANTSNSEKKDIRPTWLAQSFVQAANSLWDSRTPHRAMDMIGLYVSNNINPDFFYFSEKGLGMFVTSPNGMLGGVEDLDPKDNFRIINPDELGLSRPKSLLLRGSVEILYTPRAVFSYAFLDRIADESRDDLVERIDEILHPGGILGVTFEPKTHELGGFSRVETISQTQFVGAESTTGSLWKKRGDSL